ncbi:MAG TPA: FxLYD domain-containing protein [Casimicrobiaceae bacterium]|nr:FxLYD domain-containing protein [Casimicrobiaceae bacterium]
MKAFIVWSIATIAVAGVFDAALASNLKDQVKVEVASSEVHSGMAPGSYVCAAGHLHIKGTVHNTAAVAVGPVKVAGKVLDADGKVLGTATASTRSALNPDGKAAVDLEFLTVTGPKIDQVKQRELSVVAVGSNP